MHEGGWTESAAAWIEFIERDPNRLLLLDPVMLRLCGDVARARVLDVGCGEGRFSRMLAERGALTTGIDPIAPMIEAAHHRDTHGGAYARSRGEMLPFRDAAFDLAVSYVTMTDILGYRDAISEIARVLRPGGRHVVANVSFVTASSGWERDAAGNRLYHKVDRYLDEFPQVLEWAGMKITNWHRPLANYMTAYLQSGLILREFLEPAPEDLTLRDDAQFEDWFRVPQFTVMLWQKPRA